VSYFRYLGPLNNVLDKSGHLPEEKPAEHQVVENHDAASRTWEMRQWQDASGEM
jgi:hypothetical protein